MFEEKCSDRGRRGRGIEIRTVAHEVVKLDRKVNADKSSSPAEGQCEFFHVFTGGFQGFSAMNWHPSPEGNDMQNRYILFLLSVDGVDGVDLSPSARYSTSFTSFIAEKASKCKPTLFDRR